MSDSVMFSGNGEVGDASAVVSGNGEEDACKGEASAVVSGKSKRAVKRTSTAECPCVKRLRERRLLSFLREQGFHGAFEVLNHETIALFSVQHMQRLVTQGRWAEALVYLNAYLPPIAESRKRSRRAQIFHKFLLMFYRISKVAAGNKDKLLDKQYAGDWWCSSSDAELSLHRKRHRVVRKKGSRERDTEAIFMALKSQHHRDSRDEPTPNEALEMLVDYLDQTLQAGLRRGCNLGVKEVAPFFQMISRTSEVHSKNPGISSMTDAGTNKRLIQEGCHTENPIKRSTTVEDDIYQQK